MRIGSWLFNKKTNISVYKKSKHQFKNNKHLNNSNNKLSGLVSLVFVKI